jgi:general secretion pathway protein K
VQVALGAESWMRNILRDDLADGETDHLGELWASDLPGLPVESDTIQGAVTGKIVDLQGLFNVNNLIDENGEIDETVLAQFQRLLQVLDVDPRFAGLAADWIDGNQEAGFPDGAEDSIYTGFTPSYRTYNRPLSNVSELAALDGMDKASYERLLSHVTALPGRTAINVNTATAEVLMSLDDNLDASAVEGLLSLREDGGFPNIVDTFSVLVTPEVFAWLTESSEFFRLKAVVQIDTVRVTYFSILQRGPSGTVTTILRSLGTI